MAKAKKIKIGFIKRMLLTTEALRYQATLMRLWNCSMLYKDALSALADEQHNFQVAMIKSKSRKEMKEIKAEHVKKIEKSEISSVIHLLIWMTELFKKLTPLKKKKMVFILL